MFDKWPLEKKVSRTFFLVHLGIHKQNVYNVEVASSFCEVMQIKASFNNW